MPLLIIYLLKVSLALTLVYCFYYFALRQLTFYNWNRIYLLLNSAFCFIIPFVNATEIVAAPSTTFSTVIDAVPAISLTSFENTPVTVSLQKTTQAFWNWEIVKYLYIAVSCCFFIRFLIQLISIFRLHNKSVLLETNKFNIFHIAEPIVPFSFGKSMYINITSHSQNAYQEIVMHEKVHIQQKHFIDLIWSEIICIINWFNPFAWLLRYAIKQNLEFIADNKVLTFGVNKREYQYHLLEVCGISNQKIVNHFNILSIKKRITMMNKLNSAKLSTLRFLFILPITALLMFSFRGKLEEINIIKNHLNKNENAIQLKNLLTTKNLLATNPSYTITANNKDDQSLPSPSKSYITLGIVLDDATLQPIAGVTVKEMNYGLETKTDANGVYKITITDTSSKVNYQFKMIIDGIPNITDQSGHYSNKGEKTETGIIMISTIRSKEINGKKAGLTNSSSYFSVDPTSEQLLAKIAEFIKFRENNAGVKIANEKNERIFEVVGSQSFILGSDGRPRATIDGISPLILIDGKLLTGEELNANYKRSAFKIKFIRASESESDKKKYNNRYGIFEIEILN